MNLTALYHADVFGRRCERLAARGLGPALASKLWEAGDRDVAAELEALTDHELTRMRQLHAQREDDE